jgi:arylsulfatase A-like enzyme
MRTGLRRKLQLLSSISVAGLVSAGLCTAANGAPVAPAAPQQELSGNLSGFPTPPQAPANAPNVLLIMTDDVGFAASSTFGGPIPTPTYSGLAAHGIRYNEFHTTAMCSPTRAALLTGRNHHRVNMGAIVDLASGNPGYTSVIPASSATIGKVLKDNGYDTAWLGKDHVTPDWEITPLGPYDHWPNAFGFEYFYGFLGAATGQYTPSLVENRTVLPRHIGDEGYILDKDLATHAVNWLEMQRTLHPDKPFFLYYAPGSTHAPHQAPADWIARFKGQFTEGWDKLRKETFERQKRMGIIPKNAVLTPRPPEIPAWDSMSPDEQKVGIHMMQVYAGMLAYSDNQIGRVIDYLKQSGELKKTLIIFIEGDNGASGEGTVEGTLDNYATLSTIDLDLAYMKSHLSEAGGPKSFPNYPVGWAWAMDTPFQWMKSYASHLGGTRNDLVISWPGHMKDIKKIRAQFHHVIDIAPTIYQAVGITPPKSVDGVKQMPLQGVSMLYTFRHPDASSTHHEQYFELMGNRAFYKDGWMASTTPERFMWVHGQPAHKAADYKWELYDLRNDYSQSDNLASKDPKKLDELKQDFAVAAAENHVFPIHASTTFRLPLSARPYAMNGRRHFTFHRDGFLYQNSAFPDLMNRSWKVTATIDVPRGGADGTIIAQGDWLGGWGLFVIHGKPTFVYKTTPEPRDLMKLSDSHALSPGHHVLSAAFTYEGGGISKGATAKFFVDGKEVEKGSLARTVGGRFPEVGSEVGRSVASPLLDDYAGPFVYQGRIESVKIDLARAD